MAFQRAVHNKNSGKALKSGASSSKSKEKDKGKKASPLASIKKAIFGAAKSVAPAAKKGAPAPVVAAKKGAKPAPQAQPQPQAAQPAKKGGKPGVQASRTKGTGLPRTSLLSSSLSRHAASDADSCREVACEGLATTAGYCRLHYIKNWKKIKRKELILKEGKLNQYIEELVAKYPDKYIDAIRQDLAIEKDFAKVIYDLDLDEGVDEFDGDAESGEQLIDTIKRDFEDEGESGF